MDIKEKESDIYQLEKNLYTGLPLELMTTWKEMGNLIEELDGKTRYWKKLGFDLRSIDSIIQKRNVGDILTEQESRLLAMWQIKDIIFHNMKRIVLTLKTNFDIDVTQVEKKMERIEKKYL